MVPIPEEGSRILDTNPVKVGQNAVFSDTKIFAGSRIGPKGAN